MIKTPDKAAKKPPAASKKPASAKPAKPAEVAKPKDGAAAATAPTAPTTPPVQSATLAGKTRLVIRAKSDTWINIHDADGELVVSKILRSGKVYEVPDQPGLVLLTGNAGGLELFLDGRALASLGPVGAVRRDIPLDPDKLAARP